MLFVSLSSKSERDKTISYGIKRLVKFEKSIEDKLRRQAKCNNQIYPGEILLVDPKRLPLLNNKTKYKETRIFIRWYC
ncbi:MAG: hypothetical protein J6568_00840 [Snodgrassella sp.]|nr:hypothetical protein [Snodgrassella sp.]